MQICSTLGFKPLNNALKTNIGGCIKHIKDNNANVLKKKIFSEVISRVEYVNI